MSFDQEPVLDADRTCGGKGPFGQRDRGTTAGPSCGKPVRTQPCLYNLIGYAIQRKTQPLRALEADHNLSQPATWPSAAASSQGVLPSETRPFVKAVCKALLWLREPGELTRLKKDDFEIFGVGSCCKAQLGKCVGQALDHIVSRLAGLERISRCVSNNSIRGKGHPDARPLPCLPATASIPGLCHALGQAEFLWPHVTTCRCSKSECSCKGYTAM